MRAFFNRIISFFMSVLAFFGIVKTPSVTVPTEPETTHAVKYIAHRGATFAAPENTLPAFEAAAQDSCAGVELDVRQTQDGVLVLSHNKAVKGMRNGAQTSLTISECTYAALCELSLGQDEKYGEIRVPTLTQALELLRSLGLEAAIHCKLRNEEFLRKIARTVVECNMGGKCAYNTDTDYRNTIPVILSEDSAAAFHVTSSEALADASIRELVPRPQSIIATVDVSALDSGTVTRIREKGFSLYIWNVTADNYKTALAAAPDYIEFVSGVKVMNLTSA